MSDTWTRITDPGTRSCESLHLNTHVILTNDSTTAM